MLPSACSSPSGPSAVAKSCSRAQLLDVTRYECPRTAPPPGRLGMTFVRWARVSRCLEQLKRAVQAGTGEEVGRGPAPVSASVPPRDSVEEVSPPCESRWTWREPVEKGGDGGDGVVEGRKALRGGQDSGDDWMEGEGEGEGVKVDCGGGRRRRRPDSKKQRTTGDAWTKGWSRQQGKEERRGMDPTESVEEVLPHSWTDSPRSPPCDWSQTQKSQGEASQGGDPQEVRCSYLRHLLGRESTTIPYVDHWEDDRREEPYGSMEHGQHTFSGKPIYAECTGRGLLAGRKLWRPSDAISGPRFSKLLPREESLHRRGGREESPQSHEKAHDRKGGQ